MRKPATDRVYTTVPPRSVPSSNAAPIARIVEVPPMPITDGAIRSNGAPAESAPPDEMQHPAADDRLTVTSEDRVLLIVENEPAFAQMLLEAAHEQGLKGIVTSSGVSALALAAEFQPVAVTLDIFLPDIDGWRVLDRLKHDDLTRHIPVSVISTDESRERALKSGAFQFAAKPMQSKEEIDALLGRVVAYVGRGRRHLLAVSHDDSKRAWFVDLLGADDVKVTVVADYGEAGGALEREPVDCVVLDAALDPPSEGVFLAAEDSAVDAAMPPIILYGEGRDVGEFDHWGAFAKRAGVREVRTGERLLEAASNCMHRSLAAMPESHRAVLRELRERNDVLEGRRVMIVDDDMRNIFALTSLLEDRGMIIVSHDNGRDAVSALTAQPNVEAILMDIMMPEMDGIDTIREIRQIPACRDTPIIAVTAKAMKGDREKCMEAGAWDYLSKPVDTELMLGCLRGWLSRSDERPPTPAPLPPPQGAGQSPLSGHND
jgi:CheY-like chemotaxis protein